MTRTKRFIRREKLKLIFMAPCSSVSTCFVCFVFLFCLIEADGADDLLAASVKMTPTEVVKKLEDALSAAQEGLKGFYSDDTLTFTKSLLNPAGTLPPWITALAFAHRLIPPLFDPSPPTDKDLEALKNVLDKIHLNVKQLDQNCIAMEPGFPNSIVTSEFKAEAQNLFNIAQAYLVYSKTAKFADDFVGACDMKDDRTAEGQARSIKTKIDADGSKILNYFEESCNYTEIVLRSKQVTGFYMIASQLYSFCFALKHWKFPESQFNSTIQYDAQKLDEDWAKIAGKVHPTLTSIKQLKNCLPVFADSVDFYSKRNKNLGHEEFAKGLASNLLEKFPWINWYVFSYDDGLNGEEEHSCIGGILSHCIQRKYGRNLFVAGQQNEDNYFYNKNCPEQKECVKKLDQYKNCADAAKPFEQCIREKCKPPAGTLCKKSGDGFAAEKGKTATSDGWSKTSFGTDKKYLMHVVSP